MGLREIVDSARGFARTRELLAAGASERMLTVAVRSGVLFRARNGWYSTRSSRDPAFRAVRLGGRLTGLSALAELGCWMWREPRRVDVAVRPDATRLRAPDDRRRPWVRGEHRDVRLHWDDDHDDADDPTATPWRVGVEAALVRVILDEPLEDAVIALDWAMRSGRLDRIGFARVLLCVPHGLRGIRRWVDPRSRSIAESAARVRLRRRGHTIATAVRFEESLRELDLVVDGVVDLETDGREFHEARFEADRRRDLDVTRSGLHAIRVSFAMVRDCWPAIESALDAALAARLGARHVRTRPAIPAPCVGNSGIRRLRITDHLALAQSTRRRPEFPTAGATAGAGARAGIARDASRLYSG